MIRVHRSAVDPPQRLTEEWPSELARVQRSYDEGKDPGRFSFAAYSRREVRDALTKLFHSKCAYCEARVGINSKPDIGHFRPMSGVIDEYGDKLPGYWWLAGAWENLLLACQTCNRRFRDGGKGNFFPIGGERAKPLATDAGLVAELPLLLDPTVDEPDEHLIFLDDGTVVSETGRGQTTIRIIALNRLELVAARSRAIVAARELAAAGTDATTLSGPADEYSAAIRQVLQADAVTAGASVDIGAGANAAPADRSRAKEAFDQHMVEQRAFSISDAIAQKAVLRSDPISGSTASESSLSAPDLERFVINDWLVERISLTNVRAIRSLDLNLNPRGRSVAASAEPGGTTPWSMLLGENATGKSTVLKSAVLALAGKNYVDDLIARDRVRPSTFVRTGEEAAEITVQLGDAIRSLRIEAGSDHIEYDGAAEPQSFVLAYGATRLLAPKDVTPWPGKDWARVDNLFSSFEPLSPPDVLLRRLVEQDGAMFEQARGLWRDVLSPSDDSDLDFVDGELVVREHGLTLPVRQLSDGYQTILALVTDTLEVVLKIFNDPAEARGLVVIDEVGSHLHPRWKMDIVRQLRLVLPNMQFLATTHDPLCLRGLAEGEIILMQRHAEEGHAFGRADLPSPQDLRIDQLLTSRFFGLSTTIDPKLDTQFDEYYQLLAMSEAQLETHGLTERLEELRTQLGGVGMLGYTRRDQLIYEAIDQLLVDENEADAAGASDEAFEQHRNEVFAHIGKLWTYEAVREGLGE